MITELDLDLPDGRILHAYDAGGGAGAGPGGRLPLFWQHGSPNIGAPPVPLYEVADRLGLRWVGHDRPGYGGSTPQPGRTMASVAVDVAALADALGFDRFAVIGHSGGGPHALACAALLPDRVVAAVSMSGPAPYGAEGLDWFAGMGPASMATLSAALEGREAKERFEATADSDPDFTEGDVAALGREWSWLIDVVRPALANGPAPLIDDDLANVGPWGFDPAQVTAPALFLHGESDRVIPVAHSVWLSERCPNAELRITSGDGHISVLDHGASALTWLRDATVGD